MPSNLQGTQSIATAFLNICSLRGKISELVNFMSTRGVQLMGIAETWLKPTIGDGELSIPHFRLLRKDRLGQHGGGVGLFYHESVHVRRRPDLECDELELLWVQLGDGANSVVLGCGYRPPNKPQSYWEKFEENVEQACSGRHASTVLIGDFNVDMLATPSAVATPFLNTLQKLSLTNYVSSPTRVTSHSQSMIDLFLSTAPLEGDCATVYLDISDHFAVLARIRLPAKGRSGGQTLHRSRCIHKVAWDKFKLDLNHTISDVDSGNVDAMSAHIITSVQSTLDKHAPLRLRRRKDRLPCPWITDELVVAMRTRNHLHRKWMQDRTNENLRNAHRQARAHARKLDRTLRHQYFIRQCSTSDQRLLWSVMNNVTGRVKQRREPKATIDTLSTVFGDVVHDPQRPDTLQLPNGPVSQGSLAEFQPISEADVLKCLRTVDPRKATGSDGIPGIVLQICADVLAPHLAKLINASLALGKVPQLFKVSHISPLFKSGDETAASNYRPVSLLPIASRILEFFVKTQLTDYLTTHNLIPSSQFAYRKSHSTEDALILATNRWLMSKSQRRYTGIIMVDMSKAFDRVQHQRMITILFSLGISGTVLSWLASYLSDRFQCVKVQDTLSAPVSCSRGVPQGSVLGPLLFVLYTSSICDIVMPEVFHQEFADDIILDYADSDLDVVCSTLTTAVSRLSNWLSDIGLLLNSSKTQVMIIQPRGCAVNIPVISCNGVALSLTSTAKYLGVLIDDQLSWKPHVEHLIRSVSIAIGQLWRHGRCLSIKARRLWYIGIIQSKLTYASNAFFPCLTNQLQSRLIKSSKSGIRAIFRLTSRASTEPLLDRLSLASLAHLYHQKLLIFVFRCMHGLASSLFRGYFQLISDDGPQTQDRRPTTRGQVSNLLRLPFLPGPAGRRTMHFAGSTIWNNLPAEVRLQVDISQFKAFLSAMNLLELNA